MSPRWGFGGKGYHAAIDMSPRWGYKGPQNGFKREFSIREFLNGFGPIWNEVGAV